MRFNSRLKACLYFDVGHKQPVRVYKQLTFIEENGCTLKHLHALRGIDTAIGKITRTKLFFLSLSAPFPIGIYSRSEEFAP